MHALLDRDRGQQRADRGKAQAASAPPPLIGTDTVEAAVDATKPRSAEQRVTVVRVTPPPPIVETTETKKILAIGGYDESDLK